MVDRQDPDRRPKHFEGFTDATLGDAHRVIIAGLDRMAGMAAGA